MLLEAVQRTEQEQRATLFGYAVPDPERYGVVTLNEQGEVLELTEKPLAPTSNIAVTGLYFYPNRVVELAKSLQPSARGELEITDLNRLFLQQQTLHLQLLGRGFAWLDTGTHESLYEATAYVKAVESRQAVKIACLEEIAWRKGWINSDDLKRLAEPMRGSEYGQYMMRLANQKR